MNQGAFEKEKLWKLRLLYTSHPVLTVVKVYLTAFSDDLSHKLGF